MSDNLTWIFGNHDYLCAWPDGKTRIVKTIQVANGIARIRYVEIIDGEPTTIFDNVPANWLTLQKNPMEGMT